MSIRTTIHTSSRGKGSRGTRDGTRPRMRQGTIIDSNRSSPILPSISRSRKTANKGNKGNRESVRSSTRPVHPPISTSTATLLNSRLRTTRSLSTTTVTHGDTSRLRGVLGAVGGVRASVEIGRGRGSTSVMEMGVTTPGPTRAVTPPVRPFNLSLPNPFQQSLPFLPLFPQFPAVDILDLVRRAVLVEELEEGRTHLRR